MHDVFITASRGFDCAVEEWRQFHCDMNDLNQWLTETETLLTHAVGPDGQLDLNSARQHQAVSELMSMNVKKEYRGGIKGLRFLLSRWIDISLPQIFGIDYRWFCICRYI